MPCVTQDATNDVEHLNAMRCSEPVEPAGLCGAAAEWVCLSGRLYALSAAPRCLPHALVARRTGSRIRPISPAELAAGSLAS
jgi:hypothetical protein